MTRSRPPIIILHLQSQPFPSSTAHNLQHAQIPLHSQSPFIPNPSSFPIPTLHLLLPPIPSISNTAPTIPLLPLRVPRAQFRESLLLFFGGAHLLVVLAFEGVEVLGGGADEGRRGGRCWCGSCGWVGGSGSGARVFFGERSASFFWGWNAGKLLGGDAG